ncbi:MAG: gamma-glutamyltransferase [Acidobacteriota bacterium]|nr:gamma-glutamyltransferase [Acidobacteriota bacterium]
MRRILCLSLIFFSLAGLASAQAPLRPKHAKHAMVVSVHELASQAGVDALRRGGNAVDAAVATGFVLAVVHPQAGNIGGGGFMLVRFADGETHFVDYREKAPAAATRDMYIGGPNSKNAGKPDPNLSLVGYKSIAVPGSVAGMYFAHNKWGKLKWASLLAPAIRLAREGFRLSWEDADDLRDPEVKELADFPTSKRIFLRNPLRNGRPYEQGDVLRQPELARTLERLARDPMEFYKGRMAREIAAFIQKGGGLVTADDLAKYEVKIRRPVRGRYRGYEIIGAPPPSSGGITLIETLNILEGYDLASLGSRSADSMHLTIEALRRAFYDRADLLGDSDFAQLPVAQLLDKKYAEAWRASIDPMRATPSNELKRPPFEGMDVSARLRPPGVNIREPEHTTHYSIVDAHGNAVAVTTTLNDSFGSRVTVDKLGFLLNDEMDDFTSAPGAPNTYGLIQGEANVIQPGKRPLSAMAPTMVLKDGKLFLVLGTPGGPRIISTVANILMGVIDHSLDVQQAVTAPRFHHQWTPDEVRIERYGFSPDTLRLLAARGHKLLIKGYWSDGECIMIDPKSGELLGATDPRGNGRALGY